MLQTYIIIMTNEYMIWGLGVEKHILGLGG